MKVSTVGNRTQECVPDGKLQLRQREGQLVESGIRGISSGFWAPLRSASSTTYHCRFARLELKALLSRHCGHQ